LPVREGRPQAAGFSYRFAVEKEARVRSVVLAHEYAGRRYCQSSRVVEFAEAFFGL
jgi:hypothetical protein